MGMFKVSPTVNSRNQRLSTTCWLTCLQMMFEWKGKDSSEDTILSKMDASPHLYPYYMRDAGIAPGECKETAKMLGLRWSGDGEISADILHDLMAKRGPIWIAGIWRRGYSHVMVVTGVNKETGAIRYIDPWENYSLSDSPGTVTWLNNRGDVWKSCDASVMYWL
ncbi:MAG: papain-like cysteine protease family protein [Pyrinomonadaceae bacterium]